MKFGSSKTLLLCLVAKQPHRAIFVPAADFSSSNTFSSSGSGQFTSKRSQYEDESREVKVSVWWDFENCHLPRGANVFKVAQTITAAVRINGIKGPITITAFGDVLQLSRTNQEALSATGISLTHVPQGGKNSTDRSLITDLMCWVTRNPPPAHLFLISSDRDFASVLHKLRMSNYNILLAGYEEMTPDVLCSAASIMWDWRALVRGNNSTGKHFNQPPDGPYNSWYGHYTTPLLDPFATSYSTTMTKQQSCTSVRTEELQESNSNPSSGSSNVCGPIPKEVVKQIGLVLSFYPKGAAITELREQLSKRNVPLDKTFYGHKTFSRFLLSMPEILQVVPKGDGKFLIRACTREMDNKASSPNLSSENPKVVSVKQNVRDVKKESQSQESAQESVPVISQIGAQAKDETVKENQIALTAAVDVSSSTEKDAFYKKLNRLCFGSSEMELEHLQEKKRICGIGDEGKGLVSEGKVVDEDLEFPIASSTSSESAKEVKADTEVSNGESAGTLSRILKRFKFWGKRNAELCIAAVTRTQVDDTFAKDSLWKDVEAFITSPRGFVLVSHSRSREALSKKLKDEGPSSLRPLDVSKVLDLVSLLISDKKWIKENPSDDLPFRVTRFIEKGSGRASSGLRSIFVNKSNSQWDKADDEKEPKNDGVSSEAIANCHKLIKKVTEENPGGYNMGNFKADFLKEFGYRLDYQNLGYPKLRSLIQMIPEVTIKSGRILPSSRSATNESDSSFDELGSVPKKIHESEPSVSDDEKTTSLKQRSYERKKKEDETESNLLQNLRSSDTVEDVTNTSAFGEDKLVDGVLTSLRCRPIR